MTEEGLMEGEPAIKKKIKEEKVVKERKKHDRFNGMPEEEVSKRTLPDHLTTNLDIVIVSEIIKLKSVHTFLFGCRGVQSHLNLLGILLLLSEISLSFQIGINPGLFAAYKGHHYAGPGNHFCKFNFKQTP